MKKNPGIFAIVLFFSAFFLRAEKLKVKAWTDLLGFPVWTFEQGPVPLGEFLNFNLSEVSFSYEDYDSSADDGKWIQQLFASGNIFSVRAPEDYSTILEMAGNSGNMDIEQISAAVLNNSSEQKVSVEKKYLNENRTLSLYSYDDESLSVQKTDSGNTLVKAAGKNAVRSYYDEEMRLVKKENWDVSGGISSSKIIDTQEFKYSSGAKPVSSVVYSENERHELFYDKKGRISGAKNYGLFKKDENKPGKFVLESRTEWKYSESGKILEKYSEEYSYSKNKSKVVNISSKKEVYEYKVQDSSPDYYFYEDGKLRVSTVHSSAESYVTTMTFDGGFTVESYFENGRRKKDLLYLNGFVRSVQNYEN